MTGPVLADKDKTKYIADKDRHFIDIALPGGIVRHFQLKYHNGDNDGDNAI